MSLVLVWIILCAVGLVAIGRLAQTRAHPAGESLTDALVLGTAIVILFSSLAIRVDIPMNSISLIAVMLAVLGILQAFGILIRQKKFGRGYLLSQVIRRDQSHMVKFLPLTGVLIPLFPLIESGSLFLHQLGPDLQGHLLSAASLREGRTYSDFVEVLNQTAGETPWWRLTDLPWTAPDFKWALEVEFFLRSMRYGHAALTSAISSASNLPVAESLLVAVCISQVSSGLAMSRLFRQHQLSTVQASLLSTVVVCSHSFIIMHREGITAQLFALPLLVFSYSKLSKALAIKLSIRESGQWAIVIAALGVTMTEALQMLTFLVMMSVVVSCLARRCVNLRMSVSNLSQTAVLVVVFMNLYVLDFARVMFLRSQQSFRYSGFGSLGWEPVSTLFSFPFMEVTNVPGLNISVQARPTVVIAIMLFICAAFLIFRRHLPLDVYVISLAAAFTLFVVALTGGGYPLWKTLVMFQPMMLLAVILVFRSFTTQKITSFLLAVYSLAILWFGGTLVYQYERYSTKMTPDLFGSTTEIVGHAKDKPFVLVTPLTSGFYSYLGSSLSFGYANSGWGPLFKGDERNWPLGFYYSCDIEGFKRCRMIAPSGQIEGRVYVSDLKVEQLLDDEGRIKADALESLVRKRFGVSTQQ